MRPSVARVPTIIHLYAHCRCPQNDHVFTKMHQSAQNTPKKPQKAKNMVKFVCTHVPDLPPPSPNRPEGWFLGPDFDKLSPKNRTSGPVLDSRGSGKCVQTNFTLLLAFFGGFGVFCALWCILVKNMVIFGAPGKWATAQAQRVLGYTYLGSYFDSW